MTTAKPSIPDVVERFADYYRMPGNGVWGSLHVVLDDRNVDRTNIDFVIEDAETRGDTEGAALGRILLSMSRTQRLRLPYAVDAFIEAQAASIPGPA